MFAFSHPVIYKGQPQVSGFKVQIQEKRADSKQEHQPEREKFEEGRKRKGKKGKERERKRERVSGKEIEKKQISLRRK